MPTMWSRESFDIDLGQYVDTSHSGGSAVRSTTQKHQGSHSVLLTSTGTQYERGSISVVHGNAPDGTGKITSSCWFYISTTDDAGLEMATEGWTGTKAKLASVAWQYNTTFSVDELLYWYSENPDPYDGEWITIPGTENIGLTRNTWHYLESAIDWSTLKHVYVKLDETTYAMSNIDIVVRDDATTPYFTNMVALWQQEVGSAITAYVDQVQVVEASPAGVSTNANLVRMSEMFDDAYWTVDGHVITANQVIAPDGTTTAEKCVCSNWGQLYTLGVVVLTAGQTYTISVWARADTGTSTSRFKTWGTVSGNVFGNNSTLDTSWQRIAWTFTLNTGDTSLYISIAADPEPDHTDTHYYWGAKVEYGLAATPYVAVSGEILPMAWPLIVLKKAP